MVIIIKLSYLLQAGEKDGFSLSDKIIVKKCSIVFLCYHTSSNQTCLVRYGLYSDYKDVKNSIGIPQETISRLVYTIQFTKKYFFQLVDQKKYTLMSKFETSKK